jgi:hypothetical protein
MLIGCVSLAAEGLLELAMEKMEDFRFGEEEFSQSAGDKCMLKQKGEKREEEERMRVL